MSVLYLPAGRQGSTKKVDKLEYYCYVLKSLKDGRYYKGMTGDVERKLQEHNSGNTKSTKGYIPWILVHIEKFETIEEARKREVFLKSGVGREYLKNKLVL